MGTLDQTLSLMVHVEHILAKLGVTRRSEIAALAEAPVGPLGQNGRPRQDTRGFQSAKRPLGFCFQSQRWSS